VDTPGPLPFLSHTAWLTVFAVSYLLHFLEELWCGGGYPAYLLRLRGIKLSRAKFVALQSVGIGLLVTAVIVAPQLGFAELALVIIAASVLLNGLTHTITAIFDRGYGPGLVVSLLWIPLGAAMLLWLREHMSIARYVTGIAIGIAIQLVIAGGVILGRRAQK
jgi:hypothetical protein